MTTLLALPARDELQLSEEELARLTGTPQTARQVEWLKANGWAYSLTCGRRPVVGRLYANLKLSGVEVATMVKSQSFELDLTAL